MQRKKFQKAPTKKIKFKKKQQKTETKRKKYRVMIMRELIANVGSYCKCGYDNVAYMMSYF